MTRVMYDSVSVGNIPTDAEAVALYIDGHYNNWKAGTRRARKANHLSIAVFPSDDAAALDIENGDATPAQAPAWVRRQLAKKHDRPVLYASRDTIPAVLAELHAAGIARGQVRLWSAHYGMGPHICAPRTCAASFTADATQWTDSALGHLHGLDESLLADDFFPTKPKRIRIPKPKPKPIHKKAAGTGLAAALTTGILALVHGLGVHLTPAESGGIDAVAAMLGAYIAPAGYLAKKKS